MKHYTSPILELLLEAYQNATLRLSLPEDAQARPGQYLLANRIGASGESLPITCFPALDLLPEKPAQEVALSAAIPTDWQPTTEIALSGPFGRPFQIPKNVQRILLWSYGDNLSALLPFIGVAIAAGVATVLLSDTHIAGLPLEVEIQPLSQKEELLNWADLFIVHGHLDEREKWRVQLEAMPKALRKKGRLLATGEFPCGGKADCGLCSLKIFKSELLPCKSGPLISLGSL